MSIKDLMHGISCAVCERIIRKLVALSIQFVTTFGLVGLS